MTDAPSWWPRVRLAVSVGLLALVVSRLDLTRAAEILSTARLEFVLLALLLVVAGRFFAALRWWILLRAMSSDAPYLRLVRLTFVAMFLQFLPAGTIALEVGRVYGLSRTTEDLAASFASVLLDRLFGLAALSVVALVGLSFAPPGVPSVLSQLAWIGFAMVLIATLAMMDRNARRILDRGLEVARLEPVRSRLRKVYNRLDGLRSSPGLVAWSVAAALANTAFRILPAWLVVLALSIDVSLIQLFIIIPLVYLAGQIPISVGGLGVREVGWITLLGVIGVPSSDAIVMALLLAALVFVVSLPGAWLYAHYGLDAPGARAADVSPPASRRA